MTALTFADWVAHWGEARLAEIVDGSQTSGRRRWKSRESPHYRSLYPRRLRTVRKTAKALSQMLG